MPKIVHLVKAMVFPVVMDGCESWTIKKAECQRIDAFELWYWRTLESPLDYKEIQPVHPKGNQSWIFIGRTDAEAETPILWPRDGKNWLIGKDPNAGNDWRQEEKGMTEDEMVDGITDSVDMSLSKLWELVTERRPGMLQSMGSQRVGHDWVTELNWWKIKRRSLFYKHEFGDWNISYSIMMYIKVCSMLHKHFKNLVLLLIVV